MSTVFLAPVVFFNASATRLFLVTDLKYLDSTKNISRVSAKNQVRGLCLPGFYETY